MTVYLSDTNPNETTGGGGCLVCGSTKNPDQRGPFAVVVNDQEMASNISPNVVVCATCVRELNAAFTSEALSAGEPGATPTAFPPEGKVFLTSSTEVVADEEEVPSL